MQSPPKPILICEYCDPYGTNELSAVVDEATLTYSVVLRDSSGATRRVRRHLPTLRAARTWAFGYRDDVMRS